jgi:glutaminyl-peptide cyclotransferase
MTQTALIFFSTHEPAQNGLTDPGGFLTLSHKSLWMVFIILSGIAIYAGCNQSPPSPQQGATQSAITQTENPAPVFSYRIVQTFPHDRSSFTQGLAIDNGVLYEGTGLNGYSSLRRVDMNTGRVLQQINLAHSYFGEGIAVFQDRIYQLTYQNYQGFIYDKKTFKKLGEFSYPTEGWGLTHDGLHLIMSDGSATLHFMDPFTCKELWHINVFDKSGPVYNLNELEYIKGEIYANVWLTDTIVRIRPQTGQVTGTIDLHGLLPSRDRRPETDVLNGIAYDSGNDRLYVTGKLWPKLFEIQLIASVNYVFDHAGLYLVSLPVVPDNQSVPQLFPNLRTDAVYEWDVSSNRYRNPEKLETGIGYWLSVSTPGSITISGPPLESFDVQLSPGWNLVGAPFNYTDRVFTDPPGAIGREFLGYNSSTNSYFSSQNLFPRMGFWIKAEQPCRLSVEQKFKDGTALKKAAATTQEPTTREMEQPPAPPQILPRTK